MPESSIEHASQWSSLEGKVTLELLDERHVVGRLSLTQDVVGVELEPGLGTACPDVSRWYDPTGVIERACAQTQNPIGWRLAVCDSTPTIAAEGSKARGARIGAPSDYLRLSGREFESIFGDRCRESEGAARDSLAVRTVTGVDHQWRYHDLVAESAALAAPSDRESNLSSHFDGYVIWTYPPFRNA
jgi:hypothetical protein